MLFGVLSLMSFQLADSFFISLLGTEPLAAMGFTMPINQLLIGVQIGTGIAATALISRAIGAGKHDYAKRLGALVLLIGSGLMAALALVVFLLQLPILDALGADQHLYQYTASYWLPWLISSWAHAFLYFGNSLCRAHGDTKLPGLMMVATSLINIVLDPIFIFVLGWGLPGAALATIASCIIGVAVVYSRLLKRQWLNFDLHELELLNSIQQIGKISLPAMLSQLMPGMAALLTTRIVAGFGSAAIAAWALGTRLETFSIVIVLALTMSLPPLLGRMLGSGNLQQVRELVWLAVRFVLILQLVIALLWLGLRPWLVEWLAPEAEVAELLAMYLLWVPLSYGALGVCILLVSGCNALGMSLRALVVSILRLFACYLPAIAIGAHFAGMQGIYIGALAGNIAAGFLAWQLYQQGLRNL